MGAREGPPYDWRDVVAAGPRIKAVIEGDMGDILTERERDNSPVRVTLTLGAEDLENVHLALGVAMAALSHFTHREMANRAKRRLEALHVALRDAERER